MVSSASEGDVDGALVAAIDKMSERELAALATYLAAKRPKKGRKPVAMRSKSTRRSRTRAPEIYQFEDVTEAIESYFGERSPVTMHDLYYACRDGQREKVFEMARELACYVTGRIC